MNRLWLGAGLLFLAALWNLPAAFAASAPIRFSETDRVLVVAPHPDDETLGCGGVIQAALEAHAAVEVLYLTHGDHNEMASLFYLKKPLVVKSDFIRSGQIRMREAENAMAFLGVIKKNLIFLGYPDFGTENIWRRHWTDKNKPFRSFITRINKVPYVDDFSYGRPYRGENIAEDFEKVLLLYKPTRVFVTPPFDLNPDHRACYLYLNLALLDLGDKIPAPEVTLYLIHAHQWPSPRKYLPAGALAPPARADWGDRLDWVVYPLKRAQTERKRQALLQYASQAAYTKNFMLSFARANELFVSLPYGRLTAEAGSVDEWSASADGKQTPAADVEYRLFSGEILVNVRLQTPLDNMGALELEIFGYKKGVPFISMPKLHMGLLGGRLFVKDTAKNVLGSGVRYSVGKRRVWVRVPLKLLKEPDILFVSTRTAKEELSLDFGSWRILELEKQPVDR